MSENVMLTYLGERWKHKWYEDKLTKHIYMQLPNNSFLIIDKSVNAKDLKDEILGGLEEKVIPDVL
jgi:hypothetical protein